MDRLKNLSDDDLPEDQVDRQLEELIAAKLDKELRASWEDKLREELGVQRQDPIDKDPPGLSPWSRWAMGLAAAMALLLVSLFLLQPPTQDARQLAQELLEQEDILYPGTLKGDSGAEKPREAAYRAFNQGAYPEAIRQLEALDLPDTEDHYYLGLSYLLAGQAEAAVRAFRQTDPAGRRLQEEWTWHLSLALLLNGQETEAISRLQRIAPDEWKYAEAQLLLKRLR